ncbi:MAG: hypothetical protein Q7J29_03310 [Stagnimonas sp.]|nr:hypothetical protein [Stagnimonas sp.]
MTNKIRGRILRDTSAGEGLLMVDGKQLPFRLEGLWLSPVAPKTNMTVEVDLDEAGAIRGITAVDDAQLAKEEAQRAMNAMRDKGLEGWSALTARVSKPVLVAVVALLLGWFTFDVVGVQLYANNRLGLSFHQLFGALGGRDVMSALQYSGSGKMGFHSLVLLAAALAPLAPYLLSNRHASWGLLAPLAVMLYVAVRIYSGLGDASSQAGDIGGDRAREMASQMLKAAMDAIHLGLGFYLSLIAALYLAGLGAVRLLAARSRV